MIHGYCKAELWKTDEESVGDDNLEVIPVFSYRSDMLSSHHILQVCVGPVSPSSGQPLPAAVDPRTGELNSCDKYDAIHIRDNGHGSRHQPHHDQLDLQHQSEG